MNDLWIFVLVGYVVALPAAWWGLRDLSTIPHGVWRSSPFNPAPWSLGIVASWLMAGWPACLLAASWWRSVERQNLLDEWERLRVERAWSAAESRSA